MTSEPDSKPGRRPPTIELKATEVDTPAPAAPSGGAAPAEEPAPKADAPTRQGSAPQAAGRQTGGGSAGRLKSHAVSAGLGALAMAAIVAGLWLEGIVPWRQAAAPIATAAPGVAAPKTEPDRAARLSAAEAQTKSLGDELAALSRRLDDIAATSQGAAKQAAESASQTISQTAVQKSDIDALASRIAALESAVTALSEVAAHPAPGTDDRAARLTIAAEALRAAVERGAPYQAELTAVQSLGVDKTAAAPLEPFAATGVPSAAALAHELENLIPALRQASDTAVGATSFLGRLEANAQRLVRITPVAAPQGNHPSAIVGRIEIEAARADIAAALTDIAALPDSAKPPAADWVKQADARAAAIAASQQIATAALAALNGPAAQ